MLTSEVAHMRTTLMRLRLRLGIRQGAANRRATPAKPAQARLLPGPKLVELQPELVEPRPELGRNRPECGHRVTARHASENRRHKARGLGTVHDITAMLMHCAMLS